LRAAEAAGCVDATCDREETDGSRRTARRIRKHSDSVYARAIDRLKLLIPASGLCDAIQLARFPRRLHNAIAHAPTVCRYRRPPRHLFVLTLCMFSFNLLGNIQPRPTDRGASNIVWIIPDDMSANFFVLRRDRSRRHTLTGLAAKRRGAQTKGPKQGGGGAKNPTFLLEL